MGRSGSPPGSRTGRGAPRPRHRRSDHLPYAEQSRPAPRASPRQRTEPSGSPKTTKGNIARIDNAGVITEAKAVKGSEPFGITVAPNDDPWYTMFAANKVATLQMR